MSYRVFYTPALRTQAATQVAYMREHGAPDDVIERWFADLFDRIDSLYELPLRYPIAQRLSAARGAEIWRLVFGNYIVLYRVDDTARAVHVLALLHGHRDIGERPDE